MMDNPARGGRCWIAIVSADEASSTCMWSRIAQPTILR
jgi:hypothetical protein